MTDPAQPFDGIKIIELSTMITASLATMTMAGQGASVIKVEPIGIGDLARHIGTHKNGTSAFFANCNRGKRSIALDLKTTEGQEIVRKLAGAADILIHNYRPGVLSKLGLGADDLQDLNNRLIYVSISGYGADGPYSGNPAYDPILQAQSGIMSVQGSPDKPEFVKTLFCDKITAYTAAQNMAAALYAREKSGKGSAIDIAMLEAVLFFNWPDTMTNHTLLDDDVIQRSPMKSILYTIEGSDGYIAVSPAGDAQFAGLYQILGCPELSDDPRFKTLRDRSENIEALLAEIEGRGRHKKVAEILTALREFDIPCARCVDIDTAIGHPQLGARNAVQTVQHEHLGDIRSVQPPARYEGQASRFDQECPMLGEHSLEILQELNYGDADIDQLKSKNVIA